jgi:hypothetical protein
MVMDDLQDLQESIYLLSGKEKKIWILFINQRTRLSDLVEKLNPSLEQLPVRKNYHVSKFKV